MCTLNDAWDMNALDIIALDRICNKELNFFK